MSLFRGKRRNLLLGVSALGLIMAGFVGLFLAPDGGRDRSVRIYLESIETNATGEAFAWFSVTNTGKRGVMIRELASESKSKGLWQPRDQTRLTTVYAYALGPCLCRGISVRIEHDSLTWRGRVVWYRDATKFELWRYR